jgi:hypothetical protein
MTDYNHLPLYLKISDLSKVISLGRSRIYELLGEGKLTAKKDGKSILVETASAIAYMRDLPPAKIASSQKSKRSDPAAA